MKVIKGDLLKFFEDGEFNVIVHGCNCFNTMGAGIAKQIKEKYPKVYEKDCQTSKGDFAKLGTVQYIPVAYKDNHPIKWIVNAYTQYRYHNKDKSVQLADYDAIRKCFQAIKRSTLSYRKFHKNGVDIKIGYPMIGAGLAGGDWDIISKIIEEELEDLDHTLVIYER